MTSVNPSNVNESKSDIIPLGIFEPNIVLHWSKNTKLFHCKSESKKVK